MMSSEGNYSEETIRPQIKVLRLASNEREKISLDGVQLRAEYCHFRSGDYIKALAVSNGELDSSYDTTGNKSYSRSEEVLLKAQDSDPTQCYHFCLSHCQKRTNNKNNKENISTKSCDNIFEKYFVRSKEKMTGFSWKNTTRSEEQLSCIGQQQTASTGLSKTRTTETAASTGGLASRLISRLLRRLQNPTMSKQYNSTTLISSSTSNNIENISSSPSPWILVSISTSREVPDPLQEQVMMASVRNTEASSSSPAASTSTTTTNNKQQERRNNKPRQYQKRGQPPHRHSQVSGPTNQLHLPFSPLLYIN